jgi:hypothetical protein
MFRCCILFIVLISSLFWVQSTAQKKTTLVVNGLTLEPLQNCNIQFGSGGVTTVTNALGYFEWSDIDAETEIFISHVGFNTFVGIEAHLPDTVQLQIHSLSLKQVDVVPDEQFRSSTTIISESAIEHLQPANITDLFELLPGNLTANPDMSVFSMPVIRSVTADRNSSFGTSVYVNGVPLSSNGSMQKLTTNAVLYLREEEFGRGIDLRRIAPESVYKIEIIRGVAPARYGDLTSGVINIRTRSYSPQAQAKIKYDPKLLSAGLSRSYRIGEKTYGWVNIGAANSKHDVRKPLTSYNRFTADGNLLINLSDRFTLNSTLQLFANKNAIRYDKNSMNRDELYVDSKGGFDAGFNLSLNRALKSLKKFSVDVKAGYASEQIHSKLYRKMVEPEAYTNALVQGEHIGSFQPANLLLDWKVKGEPLNVYANAEALFSLKTASVKHHVTVALQNRYDKNYGQGIVLTDGNLTIASQRLLRPRAFYEVPAMNITTAIAEDSWEYVRGRHSFKGFAGARVNLFQPHDPDYRNMYYEPRLQAEYALKVNGRTSVSVRAGYGKHYKFAPLLYLYPEDVWFDIASVNYYDTENTANSYLVISSFKEPTQNTNLKPSESDKTEIGIDLTIGKTGLFATLFSEKHTLGYGFENNYRRIDYPVYDYNSVPDKTKTPAVQGVGADVKTAVYGFFGPANSRDVSKQGVEFGITGISLPSLLTAVNFSGAWFKTVETRNNSDYFYFPFNSGDFQRQYVAMYGAGNKKESQRLSTDARFVSQLPFLKLVFSFDLQTVWYYSYRFTHKSELPLYLTDLSGDIIPFTNEMKMDANYQPYILSAGPGYYTRESFLFYSQLNFKLSKEFFTSTRLSLFVNNLTNHRPMRLQKISNTYNRLNTPLYFGLDLTHKFRW